MKRSELKELIRQMIYDIHDSLIDEESPVNTTNNISGYDAPFGPIIKRKKKNTTHKNE